jgi:hypothetical protein
MQKLTKQQVNGEQLLRLTEAKLLAPPYSMLAGPAGAIASAVRKLTAFTALGLPPTAATRILTTAELKLALKEKGLDGQQLLKESSSVPEVIAWLVDAVPQLSLDEVLRFVELKTNGKTLLQATENTLLQQGLPRGTAIKIFDALVLLRASRGNCDTTLLRAIAHWR